MAEYYGVFIILTLSVVFVFIFYYVPKWILINGEKEECLDVLRMHVD